MIVVQENVRRPVTPPSGFFAWLAWAFFGNADDGFWGDANWQAKRSGKHSLWEAWVWWTRNPAHNLTWYVWGVADKVRTVYSTGAWSQPGWTFHLTEVAETGRHYPFINHKGRINFYAGWRPSGAFGLKLQIRLRGKK